MKTQLIAIALFIIGLGSSAVYAQTNFDREAYDKAYSECVKKLEKDSGADAYEKLLQNCMLKKGFDTSTK